MPQNSKHKHKINWITTLKSTKTYFLASDKIAKNLVPILISNEKQSRLFGNFITNYKSWKKVQNDHSESK